MDTLLQFVVTIGGYAVIFVAIGLVFYAVDKRFKAYLRRPARCVRCKAELGRTVGQGGGRLCAACVRTRRRTAAGRRS
jgi:cytochrome c-type biogenesis protein CcmE